MINWPSIELASFPGSPRVRTKNRRKGVRVLEATESWAGPGNEASIEYENVFAYFILRLRTYTQGQLLSW